jgi:hypothetical protein
MTDPQAWTAPGSRPPEGPPAPLDEASGQPSGRPGGEPARRPAIDRSALLGGDIPLRPLGISEILDGAITNIRRNPRAVLGLSLIISSVIQVIISVATYFFIGDSARDEVTPGPVLRTLGAQPTLIALALLLPVYGVLLMGGLLGPATGRTLFGLPTSLRQAWRHTRPQLPRLAGVALAVTAISLFALALPLVPFFAFALTDAPAAVGVLAAVLGFPLSVVLTVWLYVRFVLAAPALVMERRGVIGSMRRAHQLVQGTWWRTFGTLFVTLLITLFIGIVALLLPLLTLRLSFFGENPSGGALLLSIAVDTLGRILALALLGPFDAGVIALFYIDQRMRREGLDLELQTRPEHEWVPEDFMDLWRPSPLVPEPGSAPRRRAPRGSPPLVHPAAHRPPGSPPPGSGGAPA